MIARARLAAPRRHSSSCYTDTDAAWKRFINSLHQRHLLNHRVKSSGAFDRNDHRVQTEHFFSQCRLSQELQQVCSFSFFSSSFPLEVCIALTDCARRLRKHCQSVTHWYIHSLKPWSNFDRNGSLTMKSKTKMVTELSAWSYVQMHDIWHSQFPLSLDCDFSFSSLWNAISALSWDLFQDDKLLWWSWYSNALLQIWTLFDTSAALRIACPNYNYANRQCNSKVNIWILPFFFLHVSL